MERDSIVFYKDWWEAINSLPEENRLEAITAVMDYAFNGIEPEDTMLKFATAQIRMFIDRDRAKYEKSVQQRRDAIRKRWEKASERKDSNTTVYDRMRPNTKICESKDSNTDEYYNDNGNGNENGNENGNDNEQSNINITLQSVKNNAREGQTDSTSLKEQIAGCKASPIWKDGIRKKFHLKDDAEVDALLDDFAVDMVCKEIEVRNAKKYFLTWMTDRRREQTDPTRNREPGLGVGEYRNQKGHRTYANGSRIVPESAPPRPSAGHYWNPVSGFWENMI